MKKTCAALLACLLLLACVQARAEGTGSAENAEQGRTTVVVLGRDDGEEGEPTSLTVVNPTPMQGNFFTDMWGNATSDIDVRDLLHGYNLIAWNGAVGMFAAEPTVVRGLLATESPAGDHTYTMVLYDDLFYSDGTRITAWDYAFSYLLLLSPELGETGARQLRQSPIAGAAAYRESGGTLRGVRVLSEDTLSVTLSHEALPFFYEMGLLDCHPYPAHVIAPGVVVRDDGDGVYLANADSRLPSPVFTPDLLRKTILDPKEGYLSHPAAVSGPYMLTSWDGKQAEFAVNPYFKGDSTGVRPSIDTLVYTSAPVDRLVTGLRRGDYGLLNKVMRGDAILQGMDLIETGDFGMSSYPRVGLSYISFATERPTVASLAVRQAIAYCFDRDAAVEAYTGSFGLRVDGYYGIGQWMYGLAAGTSAPPVTPPEDENDAQAQAEYEETLAAYAELSLEGLNPYSLDTARAAALLEEDGWRLNAQGLREKDGTVLNLRMIYPEGNTIRDTLEATLVAHLREVGIRLTLEAVTMPELLRRWYQQDARREDMIYLASNFDPIFDPSTHFSPDGGWSYTNLADETLYEQACAMRSTEPGDVLTYMQHWIAFEERFNEVLPMLPLYSNIYFDFYNAGLRNYGIAESITWGQAIVGASLEGEDGTEETQAQEAHRETTEEQDLR